MLMINNMGEVSPSNKKIELNIELSVTGPAVQNLELVAPKGGSGKAKVGAGVMPSKIRTSVRKKTDIDTIRDKL